MEALGDSEIGLKKFLAWDFGLRTSDLGLVFLVLTSDIGPRTSDNVFSVLVLL